MADKAPCRWVKPKAFDTTVGDGRFPMVDGCLHPLADHLEGLMQANCHGCPCHEPEPAKDTTQKGDGDVQCTPEA